MTHMISPVQISAKSVSMYLLLLQFGEQNMRNLSPIISSQSYTSQMLPLHDASSWLITSNLTFPSIPDVLVCQGSHRRARGPSVRTIPREAFEISEIFVQPVNIMQRLNSS
jgi:hypothetical protein